MWCLGDSRCLTKRYNTHQRKTKIHHRAFCKNTQFLSLRVLYVCVSYVFHSEGIFQDPSYQNRVKYLGQPGSKNCSLRISNLKESDSGTYVFYLITNHKTQKMPPQTGVQFLAAGGHIRSIL